ncbi:E3 ubiquitin-protein ligase UPL4-like [Ananas comosus]|uniref:HECT-type E3 ubiquitin transferase n=1 Tax=Ananas comosus TaxID=4615 RepID=A0A6P5G9Q7_ANACO|nr:E3 ubiquitin-protein ligase UPL4-like [Ananas comosus]
MDAPGGDGADFYADILRNLDPGAAGFASAGAALSALCDAFAIVPDEFFDSLAIDDLARHLVDLASGRGGGGEGAVDPSVAVLAARAITLVCDASPDSAGAFVRRGVVPALCAHVASIKYMDLAEQCLRALEKISLERPEKCLSAGIVPAVLKHFDFFSLSTQRVVVSIMSNVFSVINLEHSSLVIEAVPVLCNLLQSEEKQIVDGALDCLLVIGQVFHTSPKLCDEICMLGVVAHSVQLMNSNNSRSLDRDNLLYLIQLLGFLASGSIIAVRILFELNIGSVLSGALTSRNLSFHNLELDLIYDVLNLVNQLIPMVETCNQEKTQLLQQKKKTILENHIHFHQFVTNIVFLSIQFVGSNAKLAVSYGFLCMLCNIFSLSTPELLVELSKTTNISSLLASLSAHKDHQILFHTLKIAEILLEKAPDFHLISFCKEGLVNFIDAIILRERNPQQSKLRKDKDKSNVANSCYCYSFGSDSSPSSDKEACRVGKEAVLALAESIRNTFFSTTSGSKNGGFVRILQNLKDFFSISNNNYNATKSLTKDGQTREKICDALHQVKAMSNLEFVDSGIIRSLACYLSNGRFLKGEIKDTDKLLKHLHEVEMRLDAFACIALLIPDQRSEENILSILVRKLQDALHASCCDNFSLILSDNYQSELKHVTIPLRNSEFMKIKVQFRRAVREKNLANFDDVLAIDLNSPLEAIEALLWPHISSNFLKGLKKSTRSKTNATAPRELTKETSELRFYYKHKRLNRSLTLFESILREKTDAEGDLFVNSSFFDEIHVVTYLSARKASSTSSQKLHYTSGSILPWQKHSFFSSMVIGRIPCELEQLSPSYDILFILKILEGLNRFSFQISTQERIDEFAEGKIKSFDDIKTSNFLMPQSEFVSIMLANKLEQQMKDSLFEKGVTPSWCIHLMAASPFLFSFDTRWKYFCITLCNALQNRLFLSEPNSKEPASKKYKVDREQILQSASLVMASHARSMDLIEIEYHGEAGTGRGPAVEFYTTSSRELQKVGLGLWRGDCSEKGVVHADGYVFAPFGLFPHPWSVAGSSSGGIDFSDVLKHFFLLGQLVARAILDGRILDLPLSKPFYKAMLDQEIDMYDIESFDPELGKIMIEFQALVKRKKYLETNSVENSPHVFDLSYRNLAIEDLCLQFTLPGYCDYDLKPGGSSKMVNLDNLEEYVSLVVDATTGSGVSRQLEAFKSGINKVFPIKTLKIFTEEELERILCGEQDAWASCNLVEHIQFDHGYTAVSPAAINLLEIMREFSRDEQRAFLQFVTGAPRVPLGGFSSLNPKLTVVQKQCDGDANLELPSVNICHHFLKLPPYTTKEKMREKLLYAMTEGVGALLLS